MEEKIKNFEEREKQVQELFARLPEEPAPNSLKTRVLAVLREKSQRRVPLWKSVLGAVSACALIAVTSFWLGRTGATHIAIPGEAVVVNVVPALSEPVAYANVLLPPGVEFYSEKFPVISDHRELRFQWNEDQERLPIVVRSQDKGPKKIRVQFFSKEGQIIVEKEVAIDFQDRT